MALQFSFALNDVFSVLFKYALMTVGLLGLFPKCGVKRRCAFIPFYRIYRLALAADMEDAGIILFFTLPIITVFPFFESAPDVLLDAESLSFSFLLILMVFIIAGFTAMVYEIRLYFELCHLFGRKKHWVLLWLISEGAAAIIWGYSKSFQPQFVTVSRNTEVPETAESGADVSVISNGLTVNLKSRTVRDFLRKKTLLRDIHLSILPGRMVLLLGGSGAGKTTFINAVIGYEKANAVISLDGKDVYKDYDEMLYNIAVVPQQDLIRYEDTVVRTLTDAAVLRLPESVTREKREARVEEVLDIFGLTSVRESVVGKLSGGQRKRLSIAMEFISDPSLFVLDEPDSGLDGVLARDLMQRLHDISRKGKTVIVITHSPDRVIDLFDDVIVLAKDSGGTGRLVFYGPVDEARSFFGREKMEDIVKAINRTDEGGEGRADELIAKFAEVANGSSD